MPGILNEQIESLGDDLEQRNAFVAEIIRNAEGRDLNEHETAQLEQATTKIKDISTRMAPLAEFNDVYEQSRSRLAELRRTRPGLNPDSKQLEYRSAGEYIIDRWRASTGIEDARDRLTWYHRVAAHQTTADNLGIIPEPVVGGVLEFIDTARPIVSALGPRPVPGGRFVRPRITQHTLVDEQSAEKGELDSQKMLIDNIPITMSTYGGYVNVSRQNIDWSVPSIMDIVVNDLAGQYAIRTEQVTALALDASTTAITPLITVSSNAAAVNAAVWNAAGLAYTATKGQGRLILAVSPDMLGAIGPLFPGINPQSAVSTGFSAGSFAQGPVGAISGITVVMSAGLPAATAIMFTTASAEVYEQRLGALQVTEPSVLGVQVAYAGYFAAEVLDEDGVIHLTA